jgi:hypothetical protein
MLDHVPITDPSEHAMCTTCQHQPPCPSAASSDRAAAVAVVAHPEQGWSLLCNGVVLFEDSGELLPDGRSIAPHDLISFAA